jgi:hypothetical protein
MNFFEIKNEFFQFILIPLFDRSCRCEGIDKYKRVLPLLFSSTFKDIFQTQIQYDEVIPHLNSLVGRAGYVTG